MIYLQGSTNWFKNQLRICPSIRLSRLLALLIEMQLFTLLDPLFTVWLASALSSNFSQNRDFRKGTEELYNFGNRLGLAPSTHISQQAGREGKFQILPSVESTLNVPATKAKRLHNHFFTKNINPVGGL
jgi:hypothetical protein